MAPKYSVKDGLKIITGLRCMTPRKPGSKAMKSNQPTVAGRPGVKKTIAKKKFPKTSVPRPADDAPSHFRSVFSTFSWADVWLQRASDRFGQAWLTRRLQNWKWQMSTAFSGCGASESAALSLEAAAKKFLARQKGTNCKSLRRHVVLRASCEICVDCQSVLSRTYGTCNYPDIRDIDFTSERGNFCTTHQKYCKLEKCSYPKRINVAHGSPVCIMYSRMGKGLRERDLGFDTHEAFYKNYASIADVLFIENVTEYPRHVIQSRLGKGWSIEDVQVDPRNLGLGMGRARSFFVAYRSDKIEWNADYSLESFLECLSSKSALTARNYFWQKLPEDHLSSAEEANLAAYRCLDKKIKFPDLSQYAANGRGRGELADGSLMTFTTNSNKIWSEDLKRFLKPTEMMSAMTIPCTRMQSKAAGAPCLQFRGIKPSKIASMAGNSMSIPTFGYVLLAAACALQPRVS